MSISDVENTSATLPSHIQTFVENRNKTTPGLSVQMDNTLNTDGVIIKKSRWNTNNKSKSKFEQCL